MTNSIKAAVFVVLILGSQAFAGGMEGGGGKGVLCGNTVRLLDLYEGQLAGYPAPTSSGNFDQDFRNYVYKLSRQLSTPGVDVDAPGYLDGAVADAKQVLSQVIDIPGGQTLDFTNDATLPKIPSDCSFVQVAVNYVVQTSNDFSISVYRDKSLWDKMPMIDQIALMMHEYTYWQARVFGQTSSDDTRPMIARMFSGLDTYEMFSPIWKLSPTIWCSGNDQAGTDAWTVYAAPEAENGVSGTGFYFQFVKGELMSSRSRAFFPGLNPMDLVNVYFSTSAAAEANNVVLNRKWLVEMQRSAGNTLGLRITLQGAQSSPDFSNGFCQQK